MVRSSGAREIYFSAAEDNEMVCLIICVAGEGAMMVKELFEMACLSEPDQIIYCQR